MKLVFTLLLSFTCLCSFAQEEGQNFCSKFDSEDYFPLSIEKKKIEWSASYYFEKIVGTKVINDKEYTEYAQSWNDGEKNTLFLREENGVIYQYEECCEEETIRFDKRFKKGHSWLTTSKEISYTIESFKGKLKTPYCEYKNLLAIKALIRGVNYLFYYKKGYGYIGATVENKLISFVSPDWKGE